MSDLPGVSLNIPVPPMLEQAVEYTGEARYFALYWQPAGDEAIVTDAMKNEAAWQLTDRKRQVVGYTPKSSGFGAGSEVYLFPAGKAAKVDQLFEAIRSWAAYHYQDGYRSGDRLLWRIADGDLTVNQLNDVAAR